MLEQRTIDFVTDHFFARVEPRENPVIYATCGIPGAGKSTFVAKMIKKGQFPQTAFILNPDRVMQILPEYNADKDEIGAQAAYEKWELPARVLAYNLAERAIAMRADIIKDMGCVRIENHDMLVRLKDQGYRLQMYYIECDVETAITRVQGRDFKISTDEIRARYDNLQTMLPVYQNLADSFITYRTIVAV